MGGSEKISRRGRRNDDRSGASFTALDHLAIDEQERISLIGGLVVIGFGAMSFFGKGFSG